jgi:hypothetical protein
VPEIEFVLAHRQNAFFAELARVLRDELGQLGVDARIAIGAASRPRSDRIQVLLPPHEYEALTPGGIPSDRIGRMIFICAEPPESSWFEGNVRLAPRAGAIFDINQASVEEFATRGIEVGHLQLGYSASWDRFDADRERDVDVVFLGCYTERRGRLLAGYAPTLARRRCELVISDNDHPNPTSGSSFLAGEDKWSLLGRSQTLLNVHREEQPPYFEWVRILEAIHCGAVVVSEDSTHFAPLEPGRHFVAGRAEDLDRLVDGLLDSPDRLDSLRRATYDYIRSALPMSNAASMIAEAAEAIAARPGPPRRRRLPRPRRPGGIRNTIRSVVGRRARSTDAVGSSPPRSGSDAPPAPEPIIRHRTGTWGEGRPISVIVAADEDPDLVGDALDSTVVQAPERIELIVVDGGAADAARRWFDEHASVPGVLLGGDGHQAAIAHGHSDVLLLMRSGDQLLPNGVDRLSTALAADPQAAFAYGIIQGAGDGGPDRIYNHFGWDPAYLGDADYIHLPALIRRGALERIGGYPADLWSAFAERGLHGAHVRQFVASSRTSAKGGADRAATKPPKVVVAERR